MLTLLWMVETNLRSVVGDRSSSDMSWKVVESYLHELSKSWEMLSERDLTTVLFFCWMMQKMWGRMLMVYDRMKCSMILLRKCCYLYDEFASSGGGDCLGPLLLLL